MTGICDFRRQKIADRIDLRADVGQRFVRVVIQFQTRRDRRNALLTLRLDVIDSVRGGDRALERRGDESAHQFRVRANVNGRHRDRRDIAARILANIDRLHRLQAGNENDEAHHDRQHRAFDEKIGKRFHLDLITNLPASDSSAVWAQDRC